VIERVEHTGELELRLGAPTLQALLGEALRALAEEVEEEGAPAGGLQRRPLAIDASGPDTLLADLLNEALFLMETQGFVPVGLEARELEGGRLRGELIGWCAEAVRPLVKAATYHRLGVWREGERWRGTVVLDV
jgi:SHS2 domain-containing protein